MTDCTVIIPVFNEDPEIVSQTYHELTDLGAEVIIVDDGNSMDLPTSINSITYPAHVGYGYAIKFGIQHATRPLIMVMDGDGQHTVSDAQKLYKVFNMIENCDMLIGQRYGLVESSLRKWGRKSLNFLAAIISRHYLSDLNSGMRIFRKDLAVSYNSILCDTFSFTTSITMSMITDGYKVINFPINVQPRISGKSHVHVVKDGFVTLYYILFIGIALRTRGLRKSMRPVISRMLGRSH